MPHIFCCGLPIALSVIGLIAPDAAHMHIVPHWLEPWIFVFSAVMLLISWAMVLRECGCECDHCHGGKSHKTQKIILGLITIAFIISIALHITAHN